MEVIGSGIVLALQMEAGGREEMGPGQGHPEMTLCGAEGRMGVTGLPKPILPSPVPPTGLWAGRGGRTIRITDNEAIHQRLFVVSGRGVNCTERVRRIASAYLLYSEKAMAPHSSTLAWKIPWTEEPGGLQSMGSLRVRHDCAFFTVTFRR